MLSEKGLALRFHFKLEGMVDEINRVVDCFIPCNYRIILFDDVCDIPDESIFSNVYVQLVSNLHVDWLSVIDCAFTLSDIEEKEPKIKMLEWSDSKLMGMMGPGWGLFMMVFWVLIIGLVIYAVLLLVSKTFEKKEDPALKILKEQFARGDIDQDEYERKRAVLTEK